MIKGAIICESLKPGTAIAVGDLRVVRLARYQVPGAAEYQPAVWSMIEFEAPDDTSAPLGTALAESLVEPGWYANWHSDQEATVVFSGKVFRYRRGDQEGRAAAKAHGRTVGVPEAQLDWAD